MNREARHKIESLIFAARKAAQARLDGAEQDIRVTLQHTSDILFGWLWRYGYRTEAVLADGTGRNTAVGKKTGWTPTRRTAVTAGGS